MGNLPTKIKTSLQLLFILSNFLCVRFAVKQYFFVFMTCSLNLCTNNKVLALTVLLIFRSEIHEII